MAAGPPLNTTPTANSANKRYPDLPPIPAGLGASGQWLLAAYHSESDLTYKATPAEIAALLGERRLYVYSVQQARTTASDEQVQEGVPYRISRYDVEADEDLPDVVVVGLERTQYTPDGYLLPLDGSPAIPGTYDLSTDTFTPGTGGGGPTYTAGTGIAINGNVISATGSSTPGPVSWVDIQNKPTTYAPSAHTHAYADITGKPSVFTPSAHTHVIGDTTGLQAALDGKAAVSHTHTAGQISGLATVATSGSYGDLSNKPTIPAAYTDAQVDARIATKTANNLTTTTAGSVLDARQGKALADRLLTVESDLTGAENEILDHDNRLEALENSAQSAEIITRAALLQELDTEGVVRQKWFRITNRTNGQPSVTIYFTDPGEPAGWGDNGINYTGSDGVVRNGRWGKYYLATDTFQFEDTPGSSGSPGTSSTQLQLRTETGKRVAVLAVTQAFAITAENLFDNATGIIYQLNTRTTNSGAWTAGAALTAAQATAAIAALTPAQLAVGQELEIEPAPANSANPTRVVLTIS